MKYRIFEWPFPLVGLLICSVANSAETDAKGIDFFEKKIRPVLVERCYRCHSVEAQKNRKLRGGLLLDSKQGLLKGGDTGPAVIPSNTKKSLLLKALHYKNEDLQMPPSGKLSERVIADFTLWIEMGAPDPRDKKTIVKKYEIDIEAGRKFWSLRPLQKQTPPKVKDKQWPLGEVDQFLLAKLESKNLNSVDDAHPRQLVRRLYIDLIGMPPNPEQIRDFIQRAKQNRRMAIQQTVDHLLASPRFGERWGRHWLDVARYGESNGGTKNTLWPDAWRYRKYVIDSFNKDMPFYQFVLEQIAGDLLHANDESDRKRQQVATAFLAMGSQPANALKVEVIGEQLDVMGRAFLGISIGCARCHDHKFDPVPTRDFYAMAGILFNTEILDDAPLNQFDKKQRKEYKNLLRGLVSATRTISKSRERLNELTKGRNIRHFPWQPWEQTISKLPEGIQKKARKTLEEMTQAETNLAKLRKGGPPNIHEAVMAKDRPGKGRRFINAKIHIRGSEKNLGEEIPRGVMQVLYTGEPETIGEQESGRLQLAKAINNHPLVARVMVNRIWHHLFGRGIVRTVDNFGTLGERPSHPDLLEWLAAKFIEENWSVKKMVRRIVLSRAYQLSDNIPEEARQELMDLDPDNVLIWRHSRRRLDAESIRDSILAASGMLDVTPPDRFDLLVYHSQTNDIKAMDKINKRAVYLPVNRGVSTDVMAVFNFPPADLVVGRRETASVPTQALFMLNSPLVIEHSQRLAKRLLDNKLSDFQRLDEACLWILGRTATNEEKSLLLNFITNHQKQNQQTPDEVQTLDAWAACCQSLFCSAEFRFVR